MSASSWNNQSLTMGYYFPTLQSAIGGDTAFLATSGAVAQFESDFSIAFSRVSSNVEELSFSFNTANVWAYWGQFNGFVITGPSDVAAIASVTYSTNSNFVATDISTTADTLSVNWAAMNYSPSTVLNLFIHFVPTAPTITITSASVLTNQAQQTITGTVDVDDAGTTVYLYDNGGTAALASAVVGADGSWSASVALPSQGANVLVAQDTNAAGTATSNSITDTLDTIAPVVTMALADDTGVSASDHITSNDALVGTAEVGAQVVIRNGTTILASVTPDAHGQWSFTPSLADGSTTLTASETDAAGNTGTATLAFTLDTHTPDVTASLLNNTGGNIAAPVTSDDRLTGTADANATVVIRNGAVQVGTAVANATGIWTATPVGLADGAYNLTVSDTDAAGNTGAANVAFTLDTHMPAAPSGLTVASPGVALAGNDIVALGRTITLSGHAEAGDAVILWDGATDIASLTADASGAWSFTETSPLTAGDHHIQAQAIDAAGTASAMSAVLTVATDSGPVAASGNVIVAHGVVTNMTSLIDALIAQGASGEGDIITAVSGSAAVSLGGGVVSYAAGTGGGSDSFSYTVQNALGQSATGTIAIAIDGGPTAGDSSFVIGYGQSLDVTALLDSLIGKGLVGDTETITAVSGHATLGSGGNVAYLAPTAGGSDSFTYTVTDQLGQTSTGIVDVTLDPGPHAANAALTVGHGQSVNVTALVDALVTPGLAGDSETITAVSGDAVLKNGAITYTAPNSGNSDSFGYTVTDQYGDLASGSVTVAVDPGPGAGFGTQAVDPHQTIDMTAYVESLITQGAPGETDTIVAVSGANVALVGGQVVYTSQGSGTDSFTYTVTDQYGDAATGTVDVKIDPGPITQTGLIDVQAGYSVDETAYVNSLITPGLTGDTDTIISVSGPDVVLNSNGSIVYSAPTTAMNDSFTYTVENQRGDISTGTVNVAVAHVNTVVNLQGEAGNVSYIAPPPVASLTNGSAVFGAATGYDTVVSTTNNTTITAYGYDNTIIAGGGNDVVNAGLADANVTVSDGNGSNVVRGFVSNSAVSLLDGNNTITLGGYTNSVVLGDGDNTINAGVGYADIVAGNGNNTIAASGYGNTITVGDGDNVISTGVGNATVSISGGADRIMAVGYNNAFTLGGGSYIVSGVVGLASFTLTSSFGAGDSIDLTGFGGQFGLVNGVWTAHLPDGEVVATFTPPSGDGLSGVSDGHGGLLVTIGPLNPPPPIQPNIVETTGGQDVTLLSTTNTLHLFGYNNNVSSAAGGFSISGDMGGSTFDLGAGGNTLVLSGTGDNISIVDGNNTISGTQGTTTIVTGAGNQTITAEGAYNSIATGDGDSNIQAGSGYATVSVGTGTNSIFAGGNDNVITTSGGSSTISLSGWNNTVLAGAGLTTVSGGYGNTYVATALITAGGIDVLHFNAAMGDVLDVMPLESLLGVSVSAFTAVTDQHDAQALDIYVTDPHASTMLVATLHGAGHGATMASLLASGSLMG